MVVLDTCALIYDALSPKQLGKTARRVIAEAEAAGKLLCSDISLWEIAMLVSKKRLDPGTDVLTFLRLALKRVRFVCAPFRRKSRICRLPFRPPSTTTRLTGSLSRRQCWNMRS